MSHDYEIETSTDVVLTYRLKRKIHYEEISKYLQFEITTPWDSYCAVHRRHFNIPAYDVLMEPYNPEANCASKMGYVTFSLTILNSSLPHNETRV